MQWKKNKQKFKYLIYFFEFTAVALAFYLIVLPIYPEIKYRYFSDVSESLSDNNVVALKKETEAAMEHLPASEFSVSPERLIINKIGVNIPIVVSKSSDYGLSQGAWLDPEGSRPDKGGNTIITGHRFKYLPPSNMTFYLLHKLKIDDIFSVRWQGEYYFYKIKETKIVDPADLSILKQTKESVITIYTCDPIYSQKNRLVVIGELLDDEIYN